MPCCNSSCSAVGRKFMSALPRKAEDALADDVALDLRGACSDRVGQRVDPLLDELPARQSADIGARERRSAEDTGGEVHQPLPGLGVTKLEHGRTDPRHAVGG